MADEPARSDRTPPAASMGMPGYFPDHADERRAELAATTPAERLAEAIRLSRVATRLAAAARRR